MEESIQELGKQANSALSALREQLPLIASRLLGAAVLILLGAVFLKLGKKLIRHAFRKAEKDPKRQDARPVQTMHTLVQSVFTYVCYFAIAMIALSALGVDISSLLTVAGVGGVAISFGCQALVKDVISGLFLWVEGRMNVGDIVTVGGQTGRVETVAIRTTTLRGVNGNLYIIPNGDIRTVVNMSRDYRCAVVDVTVAHGQDLEAAIAVLRDEMVHVDEVLEQIDEAPQVVGVIASDGRAATVRIECRCKVPDAWTVEREIRLRVLERFRREGIKP